MQKRCFASEFSICRWILSTVVGVKHIINWQLTVTPEHEKMRRISCCFAQSVVICKGNTWWCCKQLLDGMVFELIIAEIDGISTEFL